MSFLVWNEKQQLSPVLCHFQAENVSDDEEQLEGEDRFNAYQNNSDKNNERRYLSDERESRSGHLSRSPGDDIKFGTFSDTSERSVDYRSRGNRSGGLDDRIHSEDRYNTSATYGRSREDRLRQDRSSGSPFNRTRNNRR